MIKKNTMNTTSLENIYDRNRYLKYFTDESVDHIYKTNPSHLQEQYLLYLKTAQNEPEFSLLKALKTFQQFLQHDPLLLAQVILDSQQIQDLGVENPFHIDYWQHKK